MTRPLYETPLHLAREHEVVAQLKTKWNCDVRKLPISYKLDYVVLQDNKPVAVMEIKCRSAMYDEMYLSLNKYIAGVQMFRTVNLPFIVVYDIKDKGTYWIKVDDTPPDIAFGGRTDRDDWQDIEPMAVFRSNTLKAL